MEITCTNRWQPIRAGHVLRTCVAKVRKPKLANIKTSSCIRSRSSHWSHSPLKTLNGILEAVKHPLCICDMWAGAKQTKSESKRRHGQKCKYRQVLRRRKCWRAETDAGPPPHGAWMCVDATLRVHQPWSTTLPVNIWETSLFIIYFKREIQQLTYKLSHL